MLDVYVLIDFGLEIVFNCCQFSKDIVRELGEDCVFIGDKIKVIVLWQLGFRMMFKVTCGLLFQVYFEGYMFVNGKVVGSRLV